MNDMVKMVVVLTVLTAFSGGLLAAIRDSTLEQIEMQQLTFVKGPAIKVIMEGAENDPITDRFKIKEGEKEYSVFVGKFDGKANTVALEDFAQGYGGPMGVIVGINMEKDEVLGVQVSTHAETPGLGARAKDGPNFVSQFEGGSIKDPFKVAKDGGRINALSGATITSRAVCQAASSAGSVYQKLKPKIQEQIAAMK